MAAIIRTVNEHGEGHIVSVECRMSNSLPNIVIVGFASHSVYEARERIRGALSSSGMPLPPKRITLNLAPADTPKDGSAYDLPMLISIASAAGTMPADSLTGLVVIGEVGLDGSIRAVRGIIGKILAAKKFGATSFLIPEANLAQASLIPGVCLYAFGSIGELAVALRSGRLKPAKHLSSPMASRSSSSSAPDIHDVAGQEIAKRALIVAAAGHHNILLNGPPGTGKTMLARSLIGIMPPLTPDEMLETTHIHSLASRNFEKIVTGRPFRTPHHTVSSTAFLGGGSQPKPGEISLGHHGVLFLDELPEFRRDIIESLRQPLEDSQVCITRAGGSAIFPAHFLLIATSNPCPCGYFGSDRLCSCSLAAICKYKKKISGPIIDRIDLYVDVDTVPTSKLLMSHNVAKSGMRSREIAGLVAVSRKRQLDRSGVLNSRLDNKQLINAAKLGPEARLLIDNAASALRLSARAYVRTVRVARTIADLESSHEVLATHVAEALQYRQRPAPG